MYERVMTVYDDSAANGMLAQGWEILETHVVEDVRERQPGGGAPIGIVRHTIYVMGLPRKSTAKAEKA